MPTSKPQTTQAGERHTIAHADRERTRKKAWNELNGRPASTPHTRTRLNQVQRTQSTSHFTQSKNEGHNKSTSTWLASLYTPPMPGEARHRLTDMVRPTLVRRARQCGQGRRSDTSDMSKFRLCVAECIQTVRAAMIELTPKVSRRPASHPSRRLALCVCALLSKQRGNHSTRLKHT